VGKSHAQGLFHSHEEMEEEIKKKKGGEKDGKKGN